MDQTKANQAILDIDQEKILIQKYPLTGDLNQANKNKLLSGLNKEKLVFQRYLAAVPPVVTMQSGW